MVKSGISSAGLQLLHEITRSRLGAMRSPSDEIINFYRRNAAAWVRVRDGEATLYEQPWIDRFKALIPAGGMVLDLGCGSGMPIASHLIGAGYAVTGVDGSPEMVDFFRKRQPSATVHLADMRTLVLQQKFKGILAWDSFFHLNPDDQRKMFALFAQHAASGAALMFTSGPAAGESVGRLFGDELYHASLDPNDYRDLLAETGFVVIDHVAEDEQCGQRTVWLARRDEGYGSGEKA
jgi:SAM-dependent methyltransferase